MSLDQEIQNRLELARRIAREAGRITLDYFQTDRFEVQRKRDGSPLTIADQASETYLRDAIAQSYPDDAIVGEEFGKTPGDSGFQWVLDPIDGTKSFISGVPLYGTMVGVTVDNRAVIGSVYFPGLDEGIFAARQSGSWAYRGERQPVRAKVSTKTSLADSVLVTSESESFGVRGAADVYRQLAEHVYFARTWGDVYGYLLVATGRVEIMIDPMLHVWDAAAVQPIIEEAGGKFSDWAGNETIHAGEAIGSNGYVHESVLNITRSHAGKFASA
jgi:histidinol phosphatase-like enzyme (inositol monophosphatase family)